MKNILLLALLVLVLPQISAQEEQPLDVIPVPGSTEGEISLKDHLPPLAILIDSAIANAPRVEIMDYQLKSMEYDLRYMRKDWSELVFANGQYLYSDYERLMFDLGGMPIPREMVGYQVGVGVRVPLSYFVGRKDQLRSAEMSIKSAAAERRSREEIVREEVIATYNQLLLLQRLMEIMIDAKESFLLMMQVGEERFQQGDITLEDLASNTDMKAKYSAEYERLKAEYSTTYAKLERLVGVPLGKLKNLNE